MHPWTQWRKKRRRRKGKGQGDKPVWESAGNGMATIRDGKITGHGNEGQVAPDPPGAVQSGPEESRPIKGDAQEHGTAFVGTFTASSLISTRFPLHLQVLARLDRRASLSTLLLCALLWDISHPQAPIIRPSPLLDRSSIAIMAFMNSTSSIAMALAGKTASVDIPKPRAGFPLGACDSARPGLPAMLPTPPNSISPTLPPQAFRRQDASHPEYSPLASSHVESDVDLGDLADHADHADHPNGAPAAHDLDSTGAITPGMLAKHHLPEVMLQHGPLAIRHLMGYLTTSVPGFSGIPPARARRLVVAALEGRGSDDKSGSRLGDVVFEKVGWGRWDARRRGEPSRDAPQHLNVSPPSSISNSFPQRGVQIPTKRASVQPYGSSVTGDSAVFSYSEDYGGRDISMLEHEADKMSLDGNEREYCSSSEAPDDEMQDDEMGEEDVTDEEDWAQIGAAALRARSLNATGGFVHGALNSPQLRGGGPAPSSLAKSAPRRMPVQQRGFTLPEGVMGDREERAAVEALLRLGSM
ncbi:hypothetical protein BO70DRAFT_355208 [Aspergillus heteromorphus CBS 117.55]|uniref:Sin3 binding protein n=1 Tax=Aspergillus heteromorphus CBS 117.55 TaxID=1448321 RepID=A0A317VDD5_9EURO|nr:uncharacterized protein BO70DRAFT_355208 [Aspergillus heteromorphus CBS 117.55]PWY72384.1 hypothetical protein BO70DRAFT_355208 [Aspergillus heteromorphus CBS 117.55]